jgi:hypothetical protein
MARDGAMLAYTEAKRIAMTARQAADDVATLLGATHASATVAGDEATKAEAARDEAQRLSGLADGTEDPVMAAEYRKKAETEQANAQTALDNTNQYLMLAKIGVGASETQQIAAAARQAQRHANRAEDHYDAAKASADDAQDEVDTANAAVTKAEKARTDVTNAKKHLMAAMTARNAANTARDNAKTAWDDAVAAVASAKTSTTVLDAEGHLTTASDGENTAEAESETAATKAGEAETAAMKAETSANTHVVGLLMMANAYHIAGADTDVSQLDADQLSKERADHVMAVNSAIVAEAATDDNGGGEVTASWPYENAATEDVDGDGLLQISVTPGGGTPVALTRDDATTPEVDETNFVLGSSGLGMFAHEKYLGSDGTRIILFTDIEQAKEAKDGSTDTVDNIGVSSVSRVGITMAIQVATATEPRRFEGTYDHDGNSATPAYEGTYNCATDTCSVSLSGTNADGEYQQGTKVTAINGYRFTGVQNIPPVEEMPDTTHLTFGVWLTETVVGEGTNTYEFGAFADGATEAATAATVNGTATYEGSAAGVKSTPAAVDFFTADATLNADFGNETTENAEITGKIHNIVAGGESEREIYLVLDADGMDNIDTDGSFDGAARKGNPITDPKTLEVSYPFEGTWSGQFYNLAENDPATDDVDESTTTPPGSVAGTFGVTMADDAKTEDVNEQTSFVGAFGAHK